MEQNSKLNKILSSRNVCVRSLWWVVWGGIGIYAILILHCILKYFSPTGNSTTTTSSSSSSSTISSSSSTFSTGSAKMFVSAGYTTGDALVEKVDIIDLENPNNVCNGWAVYPQYPAGSVGFLDPNGIPIICGGWNGHDSDYCFNYNIANVWFVNSMLVYPRNYAAIAISNWLSQPQTVLITGTSNTLYGNTAEMLTERGWELVATPMPYSVHHHCSAMLDSKTGFVIGGFVNGSPSDKVLLFNSESKTWTYGPSLNIARHSHSCGKIIQGNDYVIIVAGGENNGGLLMSVEIFNNTTNSWSKGPSLPYAVALAGLAEDPTSGVVLVGGTSVAVAYMNSMIRLRNANPGLIF